MANLNCTALCVILSAICSYDHALVADTQVDSEMEQLNIRASRRIYFLRIVCCLAVAKKENTTDVEKQMFLSVCTTNCNLFSVADCMRLRNVLGW